MYRTLEILENFEVFAEVLGVSGSFWRVLFFARYNKVVSDMFWKFQRFSRLERVTSVVGLFPKMPFVITLTSYNINIIFAFLLPQELNESDSEGSLKDFIDDESDDSAEVRPSAIIIYLTPIV
jgi:hypothetical protein